MPNWCDNELTVDVSGLEISLNDFLNEIGEFKKDDNGEVILDEFKLDFNKIIPEPDFKKDANGFYENEDWYDWRLDNWGTKVILDLYSTIYYSPDETSCRFNFETAWSPPEGIIAHLKEKYDDLSMRLFYREDNLQLSGYL